MAAVVLTLCIVSGIGVSAMWNASGAMSKISSELPEPGLATQFEREILNARIAFIYHVTIQKAGTLEAGWKRFHDAREPMPKLGAQARNTPKLGGLIAPTERLASDLDAYEELLRRILAAGEKHQNSGDEFKKLLVQWGMLGGKLGDAAGYLESQSDGTIRRAAQAQTDALMFGVWRTGGSGLLGAVLGALISLCTMRSLRLRLVAAVGKLASTSEEIGRAAEQVAVALRSLAQGAGEQAASIEGTSPSCEGVNAMARRSMD